MGIAAGVLMHRDQAGHAAALQIFAAHGMAGALGRDHQHVQIGARLDQLEMDVEAMGEQQRRALLHVVRQFVLVDVGLQFVGRHHHHHIGPFGGVGDAHHLEAGGFRLLGRAPGRAAITTSLTPQSRMFWAWAWPWLPKPMMATFLFLIRLRSASRS